MLYKENLENMRCRCGCDEPIYFHSKCHIEVPTWVKYENGALIISCAQCKEIIAEIIVASNPEMQ